MHMELAIRSKIQMKLELSDKSRLYGLKMASMQCVVCTDQTLEGQVLHLVQCIYKIVEKKGAIM